MYRIVIKGTGKEIEYINGNIQKEENKADILSFGVLPKTPFFSNLESFVTKIEVFEDDLKIFDGRVIEITDGMNADGALYYNVTCESVLNYLNDTRVGKWAIHPSTKPVLEEGEEADPTITVYENMNVQKTLQLILDNHNSKVLEDKKIFMGNITVTDSVYCYTGFETSLNAICEKLLNRKGGFLKIRESNNKYYLDYLKELPNSSNNIELTVNMKSIDRQNNLTSICTRLIAVGSDGITFDSINGGKNYVEATDLISKYGVIEQTHEWPDVTIKENLLEKAKEKIKELNKNIFALEVTALDLSYVDLTFKQFDVSQKVTIVNSLLNISEIHRVISKTINFNDPWNSVLQFSNKPPEATNNVSHIIQENNDNRIEILMTGNRLIQKVTSLDGRFQSYREQTDKAIFERVTNDEFASYKIQTAELIASKVASKDFESYQVQTDKLIASKVSNGDFNSYKEQTAELIASKVSNGDFNSYKTQTANLISSKVSNGTFNSYVEQTDKSISSKVSNGKVISAIEQSSENIKISASKVNLSGLVTISALNEQGGTTINGHNIKTGEIDAVNISGVTIDGSKFTGGNIATQNLQADGNVLFRQNLSVAGDARVNKKNGAEGGLYVEGDFGVGGNKNRIVTTKSYGDRALNAMESADCLFFDYGRGIIKNGKYKVIIDEIFKETVNLDDYDVFITKYNSGDVWISEKNPNFFIVRGTNNLNFSWQLVAKQLGYENIRLQENNKIKEMKQHFGNMLKTIKEENAQFENTLKIEQEKKQKFTFKSNERGNKTC